jgi:hypothetical protein
VGPTVGLGVVRKAVPCVRIEDIIDIIKNHPLAYVAQSSLFRVLKKRTANS